MAYLGNKIRAFIRTVAQYEDDGKFRWLAGEQSNNYNRTAEAVEASDKSDVWAKYIPGKLGGTIEVTVYASTQSEGQMGALNELATGTPVEFLIGEIDPDTPSAISGDYGLAVVTAISDTNDFGAVASRTISLQVTGEITPDDMTWDQNELS